MPARSFVLNGKYVAISEHLTTSVCSTTITFLSKNIFPYTFYKIVLMNDCLHKQTGKQTLCGYILDKSQNIHIIVY